MTQYKLNYFSTPDPKAVIRRRSRQWAATLVTSILFLVFAVLFFGGVGTAFRYRGQHHTLRQQHNALRLRYDSLYAAKLQADRQLKELQKQFQFLQRQPRPDH